MPTTSVSKNNVPRYGVRKSHFILLPTLSPNRDGSMTMLSLE